MTTNGQTINDRLNAVRYALVGQGLARTVCKATTEEVLGPKKKHIDYLIACTNEPNVSIPQLANLLIERTQHASWAVVFKALTTIHHLMSSGNERFTQYLATSNHSFELNEFMDRTTPQGYGMSTYVRRYAKYINDKTISYRSLAIDLCKIKSGNDNALRTMNLENLSKTLPIVHAQFDSLLEFGADTKDLNNGIIMAAFRLLYKDLVRLYVAYQEAIINLLERYFQLSRKKTREALEMYKKYLSRMDKVVEFLNVVDAVGLDKSEMPDLTKSPASILTLLEQHLEQLEAKKKKSTPESQAKDSRHLEDERRDEGESPAAKSSELSDTSETRLDTPKKDLDVTLKEKSNQPSTSSTVEEKEAEKQQAPPKPARPSPKVSPKASPVAPKVPKQPQSEKRAGPPERPAKPPSRPPPPSAATLSNSSSGLGHTSGASTPSNEESKPTQIKQTTTGLSSNSPTNVSRVSSSPVPPPHPPPPTAHSTVHRSTPSPTETPSATSTSNSVQTNGADPDLSSERVTCTSSIAAPDTDQVLPTGTESHELNHVETNGNSNEDHEPNTINTNHSSTGYSASQSPESVNEELEMPPPPPPIADEEALDNQDPDETEVVVARPDSVANGEQQVDANSVHE